MAHRDRLRHRLFTLGVLVKGLDGLLEVVAGLLLLAASHAQITTWVFALTRHELVEDPRDVVANLLRRVVLHLSTSTQVFGAAYLLGHGAIKIFLAGALLRNRRWAYPAALAVIGGFIAYQLYRVSYSHSLGLAALTLFDTVVEILIYAEYRATRVSGL